MIILKFFVFFMCMVLNKKGGKEENMEDIIKMMKEAAGGSLDGASDAVLVAMFIVGVLLVIASIVALCISIVLSISYVKYNRKDNSLKKSGEEIARKVLDDNGLNNIKVSKNGSILFGNSY